MRLTCSCQDDREHTLLAALDALLAALAGSLLLGHLWHGQ